MRFALAVEYKCCVVELVERRGRIHEGFVFLHQVRPVCASRRKSIGIDAGHFPKIPLHISRIASQVQRSAVKRQKLNSMLQFNLPAEECSCVSLPIEDIGYCHPAEPWRER